MGVKAFALYKANHFDPQHHIWFLEHRQEWSLSKEAEVRPKHPWVCPTTPLKEAESPKK